MNCRSCQSELKIMDGYINTCINCGLENSYEFDCYDKDSYSRRKYAPYDKEYYFKSRLRKLTNSHRKNINDNNYKLIIDILKEYKVKSIHELNNNLIKLGMFRYRKWIYKIYYDLTGKQLMKFSNKDIQKLCIQFRHVEKKIKKFFQDQGRRGRLINYNIILYLLLFKNYYDSYNNILLPNNAVKIIQEVIHLFN